MTLPSGTNVSENTLGFKGLIKEVLLRRRSNILKLLKGQRICISTYNVCHLADDASCMEITELSNDKEELDKNVCLNALSACRNFTPILSQGLTRRMTKGYVKLHIF